jgi:hypothetical protein
MVVINEQFARAQFNGENSLGKVIWMVHAESLPGSRPRVVVGIVADSKMYALDIAPTRLPGHPLRKRSSLAVPEFCPR